MQGQPQSNLEIPSRPIQQTAPPEPTTTAHTSSEFQTVISSDKPKLPPRLIIAFSIGLIILSGIVFYVWRQSIATRMILDADPKRTDVPIAIPSPTAEKELSWQTLRDIKQRFSLQYPNSTLIASVSADYDYVYYLSTSEYRPFTNDSYQIQIEVISNPQGIPESLSSLDPNTSEADSVESRVLETRAGIPTVITTYKSDAYKKYELFTKDWKAILIGTGSDHSLLDLVVPTFTFITNSPELVFTKAYNRVELIPDSQNSHFSILTNKQEKYSFKYPSDWYIWEPEDDTMIGVWEFYAEHDGVPGVWIRTDITQETDPKIWWENDLRSRNPSLYDTVVSDSNFSSLTVDGRNAYFIDTNVGTVLYKDTLVMINNGKAYALSTNLSENRLEIFNELLESFKFLE